jgi:hypothetical protein
VSSFRLICITAFTAAMIVFVVDAAAAQSAAATDQAGKHYLAGLHPPPEQHKPIQAKTSHANVQHKATTKSARAATKRQPTVTAKSKGHRSMRLAEKINSRVAWPSVEPVADERTSSQTVLQFATEDPEPRPAAAARPITAPTSLTGKTATAERNSVESAAADAPPPTTGTMVQTERYQAPAPSQIRVIGPAPAAPVAAAPIEAPSAEPARHDQNSSSGGSSTAQLLSMVGGAITACVVGFVIFGFGSTRKIKATRIS